MEARISFFIEKSTVYILHNARHPIFLREAGGRRARSCSRADIFNKSLESALRRGPEHRDGAGAYSMVTQLL